MHTFAVLHDCKPGKHGGGLHTQYAGVEADGGGDL